MMNENERWKMYGLQAIERVNGKRMVWNEFAEAMRVLKLAVDRDVLEHLQQLEKDPDSFCVLDLSLVVLSIVNVPNKYSANLYEVLVG
jgi:hypothetical protein